MIAQIQPGTLVSNRYRIQKLLGQGGFGRTYLAFDTQRFGEKCVLKEFIAGANAKADIVLKSQELFEREAKVLYQIQHPQIPKFLAWLTEEQRLFIVQEYIDGQTYWQILNHRLSQQGRPFSEAEVRAWLIDMLPVLEYIHGCKIIHRDISLDNIMLPHNKSKPILIDFGVVKDKFTQILASETNIRYSSRGSIVGKIGYSPPEQLRFGNCYPCSDLYALGVCAVVLLTGKMPHMLIDNSLRWKWRSHVRISDFLAKILAKMLAELPSDRYQLAKEILLELNPSQNHIAQTGNQKAITEPPTQIPVSENPRFLEECRRELTSFVGPLASVLIERTLDKTPQIATKEFIKVLSEAIPNPEIAQKFVNSVKLPVEPDLLKLENMTMQEPLGSYPAISNPKFLETCRRELTSLVGTFASAILRDTLDQYPHLTPEQLVETLVAEIPNQKRAEQFKERVYRHK
ncbi:serine/threonine protein kinase [Aetokthonos hydrillicola Thurmond2011]|jgi:serine/threonine-protein kinase|uniref:non-specific serine/threonine protein kinase n=1 Tax=Aetokthonos hydrillicola Thurmond2011 TaxID=2712845 RepID=A0AAP5I7Y8_9CYAN|nr:serine/threonine-protein kinase [Aetokthonos hydrillicola]MBO3458229.1 serine/threonine protein kinase [Aetokthonos hydrillicola CCALA 1050]MBW4584448.1 serine/threonine protein kinase [Aetokthonos hydrillicola CCALA 1050]MDR9896410.1 serine/threonine protein kinase [Aetokthonos hydrillicola Thurmond2011]